MWSDTNGNHVTIRELGCSLSDREIEPQRHIVAYFVTGRKVWKPGEAGARWAYEDCYIKVGLSAPVVATCMREVQILADQTGVSMAICTVHC